MTSTTASHAMQNAAVQFQPRHANPLCRFHSLTHSLTQLRWRDQWKYDTCPSMVHSAAPIPEILLILYEIMKFNVREAGEFVKADKSKLPTKSVNDHVHSTLTLSRSCNRFSFDKGESTVTKLLILGGTILEGLVAVVVGGWPEVA
ncbi:hypothetical protein VNO78_31089 [Psophocarpus tetragonolobus]|uniref:Uncharacterized protein n=1 Tax=Psophocarpus tetragonolobus TaxID=3891 RepID=A0AAN9RXU7_PSOTE